MVTGASVNGLIRAWAGDKTRASLRAVEGGSTW